MIGRSCAGRGLTPTPRIGSLPLRSHAAPAYADGARRVRFAAIAAALPPRIVTSDAVEEELRARSPAVRVLPGLIEMMTGIRSRRYAAAQVNTSDLAAEAGR